MRTIRRIIRRCYVTFSQNSATQSRIAWDGLYQSGEPNRYRSLDHCARYGVIEAYCKLLGHPASVLDVGCGVGILFDRFDKTFIAKYCGIDISPIAIESARKVLTGAEFIVGPAERLSFPEESFDIVIFNESLYYLDDMSGQFRRYLAFLTADGFALVSITGLRADAQQKFGTTFATNILSQTSITDHGTGKSWSVYLQAIS